MCGLVGVISFSNVNQDLYDALTVLQHRGQDAAGILTSEDGIVHLKKGNGLVRDVFHRRDMNALIGKMGIGHVRYPTAGTSSPDLAQPFYVNSPYGISLAHNGNLTNTDKLSQELFEDDLRHVNTSSDSEVLLNVFAHELQQIGKHKPTQNDFFKAVEGLQRRCKGGFAVVCLIVGHGLIAFRDPNGIRPLVYGKRESEQGLEYMVASESVALDTQGFELIDDVAPGQAVFFDLHGNMHKRSCSEKKVHAPCIFEHVYFSRPDSIMDGISVYKSRLRMGEKLAAQIEEEWPDHDIDVVMPIPDTARTAAIPLAHKLGVKFREGLIKNRYIGRTFIMPGQTERKKSVQQKLNAIRLEFEGKNVLLVDDSIVRGTTCKQIVQMARDAGAKNVYFASAAPAVRFPNVYGIDMPAASELIAHDRTTEEVRDLICADRLIYLNIDHLIECTQEGNPEITNFECSVFTGEYVTEDVDQAYLDRIEADRNDLQKQINEAE